MKQTLVVWSFVIDLKLIGFLYINVTTASCHTIAKYGFTKEYNNHEYL